MIEVLTGQKLVSDKDLFARVSQCVAVGTIDETARLGGIAHIHSADDYQRLLDEFFQEMLNSASKINSIYVAGGSNAFVSGLGFINGEKTAENVLGHIGKNFPNYDIVQDVGGDFVRRLEVYAGMGYCQIKRKKE